MLVGIALFLTIFVMAPTIAAIKKDAVEPLQHHQISTTTALKRAEEPMREFMFRQTRTEDIALFINLAHAKPPHTARRSADRGADPGLHRLRAEDGVPDRLPDLPAVPDHRPDRLSSTLMSMGMIMLPPTFISLPFKILLFVLVDGWDLVIKSLVQSFH